MNPISSARIVRTALNVAVALLLASCDSKPTASVAAAPKETADAFVARTNNELLDLNTEVNAAQWTYATYINQDTEYLNSKAEERLLEYFTNQVKAARPYESDKSVSAPTARSLVMLKRLVDAPAPDDAGKRKELSEITSRMEGNYGAAKWCPQGPDKPCMDQTAIVHVMAHSRNYDELAATWAGWHSTAQPIRKDYVRFVELANEGAKDLGYSDVGAMWRSGYDMPPEEFVAETSRLWNQVKPLYSSLQCYVRRRLQKTYGAEHVPDGKPIPAHLLGNLWAQDWSDIYDLVEPYKGVSDQDVTAALQKQKYDARRITKSAENFYVSLGFPPLPETFWQRSMLVQPRDRDVQCHASAWHMDAKKDVRVKMCIEPNLDSLTTIYHELGHVFYYLSYNQQPYLFQNGANDGFHEAIGDTVNLSMTPGYLHQIGLAGEGKRSQEATIDQQMKLALAKVAFLPFGKMIDEWRWKVFSGEIKPSEYNSAWWKLREEYQGVSAPVARTEEDFDAGAKYHVAADVPYTRYFLSYILQFQFHRALCDAAGFKGPLNECSIYGNQAAGKKFHDMLAMGSSEPWPDALEKLTGTRQMDATAILDYFNPLMTWLDEQNKGQTCGW
jgi:peptidyl-dipeptidase A